MIERHTGRHAVATALQQQALRNGEPHRGAEIGAGDRAAGAGPAACRECDREGRTIEPFAQPRRDETYDAGMPALHGGHEDGPILIVCEQCQRLGFRLLDSCAFDHLTFPVEPIEVGRDPGGIDRVARQQQARAERRVADASSGIDARPDQEPEMKR